MLVFIVGTLGVPRYNYPRIVRPFCKFQMGVVFQKLVGYRKSDRVGRNHPFLILWMGFHIVGKEHYKNLRPLRVAGKEEGPSSIKVVKVVIKSVGRILESHIPNKRIIGFVCKGEGVCRFHLPVIWCEDIAVLFESCGLVLVLDIGLGAHSAVVYIADVGFGVVGLTIGCGIKIYYIHLFSNI